MPRVRQLSGAERPPRARREFRTALLRNHDAIGGSVDFHEGLNARSVGLKAAIGVQGGAHSAGEFANFPLCHRCTVVTHEFGEVFRQGAESLLEQTAGGIHAAFLVAASLSLLAIVGAFFIRSAPENGKANGEVPAAH